MATGANPCLRVVKLRACHGLDGCEALLPPSVRVLETKYTSNDAGSNLMTFCYSLLKLGYGHTLRLLNYDNNGTCAGRDAERAKEALREHVDSIQRVLGMAMQVEVENGPGVVFRETLWPLEEMVYA
jgi:hypothetical protein